MAEVIGTIASVASLLLGVGIYWFDVRKKFEELLRNQEGILNRSQANDLAQLYLNTVRARLSMALWHYADNDLPGQLARSEVDKIMMELLRAYDTVVRQSIRPMVTNFRLRGRHRFDDLINGVSRDKVNSGFERIRQVLNSAVDSNQSSVSEVLPRIEQILIDVSNVGEELLLKEIDKLYPMKAIE